MKIIENKNERVLTTSQIADAFETETAAITKNFNRNKERYTEGKHYIALQGDDLRRFKTEYQIDSQFKHSHTLYLWTEKGTWMHAKSLNTDKAWAAYELLVDDYFKKAQELQQPPNINSLSPQLQFMIITEQRQNELEAKQTALQAENDELRKDMRHLSLVVDNEIWVTETQKAEMRIAVNKRIGELKTQAIDAHFQGLYGDLKTFFMVSKYDKIARKDFEQAAEFIKGWFPKRKENTPS